MPERFVLRIEIAKVGVVAEIILSRHDLHTRGRADRRRIAMIKPDTVCGQLVYVRCMVVFRAISAEAFPAYIVCHDQDNIRVCP